ncbi:MAG TPA: PDZ domain-containing protein [Bacillus bacterium]|uniref:Serine protease Do-like HtrA n=1 Tax=Siminovitchia fordii TaxID=254759 RepID=A0ABQ4KA48_9BACI|nr:trypsin-like peptidase domain-containing protein [Siminovitchia fordii]GIN21876.1 serine protease Do-like HtrA [Siminovitchia fordii]HBZ11758.1 PDZ domain-containing protein [Bacillus sp. (in: firmicutes)]
MFKRFLSMFTAAVMGAAITLASVQYFGSANQTDPPDETATNTNAQKVAASSNSIADIVEQSSKAIVGVVNKKNQTDRFQLSKAVTSGTGSGVIYKKTEKEVFILTNNHVIEGASQISISLYNGKEVEAELIGTDALTDIAVLRIKGNYDITPLQIGDSTKLRAGDRVIAIGNPLGLDLSRTVTQGIVSAVNRTIEVTTSAGDWDLDVIQTDAAINPGNSGGALINDSGELVGINSLKISENGVEGLGFAIPINEVTTIAEEIIKNGQVVRPYLGVSVVSLDKIPPVYLQGLPETVTEGVMVASIDENSEIAKAGLRVQDVIVSINGKSIKDEGGLRKFLYTKLSVGDQVTVKVYRKGEKKTFTVKLESNKT